MVSAERWCILLVCVHFRYAALRAKVSHECSGQPGVNAARGALKLNNTASSKNNFLYSLTPHA